MYLLTESQQWSVVAGRRRRKALPLRRPTFACHISLTASSIDEQTDLPMELLAIYEETLWFLHVHQIHKNSSPLRNCYLQGTYSTEADSTVQ